MIVRDHPFLQMALGLHRACTRLDELLDRYAPETGTGDSGELDETVALVLGMIAIRMRLGRAFEAMPEVGDAPAAPARPLASDESWLR